jgi:transcriptional regulator GlxA family with amidase domain
MQGDGRRQAPAAYPDPCSGAHTVAAVVGNGVSPFELAVACEVFGHDRSELVDPWYELRVCAAEPPPLRATGGITIDTPYGLDDVAHAGTVIVPGWRQLDEVPSVELLDALRAAHARGARILSVCSGAFALAHAGLLDGRRATTHWMYAAALAERFPAVEVDPDVLYVVDGSVMTSAGTAAGIDLCLHLVRLDHGAAVANAVARRMVVPPHRAGGQSQFVQAPVRDVGRSQDPIAEVMDWAVTRLAEPLAVDRLAAEAAMSPRTFARRFREVAGTTPHQWLVRQRVLHAQGLLETTGMPVDRIADEVGFGSAAVLRQHFGRIVGTSPLAYRRTFEAEQAS